MSKKSRPTSRTQSTSTQNSNDPRNSQNAPIAAPHDQQRFAALVAQGDFNRALEFLQASGKGHSNLHDKAVCLMRLGRFTEAVEILRKLVLNHDCVWMRKDIPLVYKTNYSMALLLGGHPAGCESLLGELDDESIPAVIKMRAILKDWEKSMTLWQRLNWRWLGIGPAHKPVQTDGLAGDFEVVLVEQSGTNSLDVARENLQIAV